MTMARSNRTRAGGGWRSGIAFVIFFLAAMRGAFPDLASADEALNRSVFPEADRFGPMTGAPPAAAAYRDGAIVGYVFHTRQVVGSVGYSQKPLDVLVGLRTDGVIAATRIVEQNEPILVIGVTAEDLHAFADRYRGRDIRQPVQVVRHETGDATSIEAVAGATISSVVISDAILQSARAVARDRGLFGAVQSRLDLDGFQEADWDSLVAEGSLVRLQVRVGEAEAALAAQGARLFPAGSGPRDPDAEFVTLYLGLATPARVGRNLLGDLAYNRARAELGADGQLIFIGGDGLYSFKGTRWVRTGLFDRIQIVQGNRTLRLTKTDYRRIDSPADTIRLANGPPLREAALFRIEAPGLDPAEPWTLELLVAAEAENGTAFASFAQTYTLPDRYRRTTDPATAAAPGPAWLDMWRERLADIAILAVALVLLTSAIIFQDALVARRRLYVAFRIGFLAFVVLWLGWYAAAQLSVLNVLTFAEAVRTDFKWEFFLIEPLVFILWSAVAVGLLFLGRGIFCGWLCPFGAMQDLLGRLAQWLRIPQISIPFALNERLWPAKYILFLGLVALSLGSVADLPLALEVEPFKTAIVLHFHRPLVFVLYAAGLLAMGLFVNRFFCRYLCPLGAALALPARLRMFDWLKRRWECGRQCRICAVQCPVQAIHPDGHINPNECIHCLKCQSLYYDDQTCPPLIERRKRREARRKSSDKVGAAVAAAKAARKEGA
ncbi:MAG: NosR/NirI family protein [Alphaproteobacteria bacterium]|nr:NosR/NirI family protein [Alphaproteobacteria bacterium]